MNNLVLFVGVLDVEGSTNVPMALSLAKLGYRVIPINYRSIIMKYGMPFFENLLLSYATSTKPALILFSKCNGINPAVVAECSKYAKTWLYNMDPRATIENCMEVVEHAKNAHFSSCTAKDMVEWFSALGARNCHHLIQGVDQDVFKPIRYVKRYEADISFIGSKTPERDFYQEVLIKNGYDAKFYGPGYTEQPVIEKEFAKVCASSTFMLSLNTYNNVHTEYFSNRLLRYLSCGVCTFHFDTTGSLDKYFRSGKDIVYFSDEKDLLTKLKNTTLEAAGEIAVSGRDRVLRHMTWDHIIIQLLKIAGLFQNVQNTVS